jgi:nicotinamidase-related amidase
MEKAYGLTIPQTLDEACEPARMALLVYDMQVGVLSQIAGADAVTSAVVRVLDAARRAGVRVLFSRHLSLPKEIMGVVQLRMAMAWQRVTSVEEVRPWFLRGSPGLEIAPAVTPLDREAVLDKITMSAFEGTWLDIALRDCGITTVAVVGVATEVGIEPTVRHAADLGYIPVVVSDACGAGNREAAERSLAGLRFTGDAMFTDVATLCDLLSARARAERPGDRA